MGDLVCWLCGKEKGTGHSARCSVTRFGVKERWERRPPPVIVDDPGEDECDVLREIVTEARPVLERLVQMGYPGAAAAREVLAKIERLEGER